MLYDKNLIIHAYNQLLADEYEEWSIGAVSPEVYFELRLTKINHHCPCQPEDARAVITYFTGKGLKISQYHEQGADGVLFLKL